MALWLIIGFSGGSVVKNLPAEWEIQVLSLGYEDPLVEGMTIHSHIPAWRIPWTEEPGRLQSIGWQRVKHYWCELAHTHPCLISGVGIRGEKSDAYELSPKKVSPNLFIGEEIIFIKIKLPRKSSECQQAHSRICP